MILETGERTYFNDAGWDECEYRIIKVGPHIFEFVWDAEFWNGPMLRINKLERECAELQYDPEHICDSDCEDAYEDEEGVPWFRSGDESQDIICSRLRWHILTPEEMIDEGFEPDLPWRRDINIQFGS